MSDIKDLGSEKTVLDGTEFFPGQQTDGTTFHAPASALGVGPFTDGDGNVYSIEYDEDEDNNQLFTLKCVDTNGRVSRSFVWPGGGGFKGRDPDTGNNVTMTFNQSGGAGELDIAVVDVENSRQVLVSATPTTGLRFVANDTGTSVGHELIVSQDDGFKLDGVVVDPTQPWPGG